MYEALFLEYIKIRINQKKKGKKVNNGQENCNNKQKKKIKEIKGINKIRIKKIYNMKYFNILI